MAMLDPWQMRRQGLAASPDAPLPGRLRPGLGEELLQLRLDRGLVGGDRFLEQFALSGGGEGLAGLAEAQAFVVGQFEGEGLDLEVGGVQGRFMAGNRLAGFRQFGVAPGECFQRRRRGPDQGKKRG